MDVSNEVRGREESNEVRGRVESNEVRGRVLVCQLSYPSVILFAKSQELLFIIHYRTHWPSFMLMVLSSYKWVFLMHTRSALTSSGLLM